MLKFALRAPLRNSAATSLTVAIVAIVALFGAFVADSQTASAQTLATAECGSGPLNGRTQVVVDAIMAHATFPTSVTDCEDATTAHLNALGGTLDLNARDADKTNYHTPKAADFAGLTGIRTLDLQGNGISSLPADFFDTNLEMLTRVRLGFNAFTTIATDTFEHWTGTGERRLELENNQITSFASGAFNGIGPTLRILVLDDNPITSIPGGTFSTLTTLTHLLLDRTKISGTGIVGGATGSFQGLTNVRDLRLRDIDELTTIPRNAFQGMSSLLRLRLERSGITTIYGNDGSGGSFSGITTVTHLTLQDNELTEIPRNAFPGMTAMTNLNLERNKITTIYGDPPATPTADGSFSELEVVTQLTLQDNQITAIPPYAFFDMGLMTKLNLERNQIATLYDKSFDQLPTLDRLLIHDNLLEVEDMKVDFWDDGMANLTILYLSRNKIDAEVGTDLGPEPDFAPIDFPQHFFQATSHNPPGTGLTKIVELGLDDLYEDDDSKGLQSVYHQLVSGLPLKILRLNNNPIGSFDSNFISPAADDGIGPTLEKLYLHEAGLFHIPDHAFRHATALKGLFLHSNRLHQITKYDFATSKYDATTPLADTAGLEMLEQLHLHDNPGAPFNFFVEAKRSSDNQAYVYERNGDGVPVDVTGTVTLKRSDGAASDATLFDDGSTTDAYTTFTIDAGADGHSDGVLGTTPDQLFQPRITGGTLRNWDNSLIDNDYFDVIDIEIATPDPAKFTTPEEEADGGICQDFDRICFKGFAITTGATVYPGVSGAATGTTLPLAIDAAFYEGRANRDDNPDATPPVVGGFSGWKSPTNADGDKVVTAYYEYRYRRAQNSEGWATQQSWTDDDHWGPWVRLASTADKTFTLTGLSPAHRWEVETRAVTIMGTSNPPQRSSYWTTVIPGPSGFRVVPGVAEAVLSWDAATGLGGNFVGYRVRYREGGTSSWSGWITVAPQYGTDGTTQRERQTHSIFALDHQTPYDFQVVTETVNGVLSERVGHELSIATFVRVPEINSISPEIRSVDVVAGTDISLELNIFGLSDIKDNALPEVDGSQLEFTWSETSGSGGSFASPGNSRRVIYTAPSLPGTYTVQAEASPPGVCHSDHAGFTGIDPCTAVFTVRVSRAPGDAPPPTPPVNPEDSLIPTSLTDNTGTAYAVFTPVEGGTFTGEGITVTAAPSAVPDLQLIGVAAHAGDAVPAPIAGAQMTLDGTFFEINGVQRAGQAPVTGFRLDDPITACIPLPDAFRANVSNVAIVERQSDGSLGVLSSKVRQIAGTLNVCGGISELPATVAVAKLGVVKVDEQITPPAPPIEIDVGAAAPSNSMALWTLSIGMLILFAAAGTAYAGRAIRGRRGRSADETDSSST